MGNEVLKRQAVLEELRRRQPEFERLYGVTKIGIFGSLARNESRSNSDIDVVVQMREPDFFLWCISKRVLKKTFNAQWMSFATATQ
jgi:predicted nucleotidyltransferase